MEIKPKSGLSINMIGNIHLAYETLRLFECSAAETELAVLFLNINEGKYFA